MAGNRSRTLPMIKIVGYPGEIKRTFYKYEQMTYTKRKKNLYECEQNVWPLVK